MSDLTKWKELQNTLIVGGIFTLALLIADFTYSNLGGLLETGWGVLWMILHGLVIALWIVVIKYWNDPAKAMLRVFLFAAILGALIITMGHRAGWLEDKQVIIDSRK